MADLLDFDALWAERTAEPLAVRAFGERHVLPGSRPAGLTLHMHRIRAERGPDHRLTWTEMEAAARFIFGPEVLQRWLEQHRITEDQLADVVMGVLGEYARREPPRDDPGKATGASGAPTT